MFTFLFLLTGSFCYKPEDLTWTYFNGERNVTFLATIPNTADFKVSLPDVVKLFTCCRVSKTPKEAYAECTKLGMNLVTVSSEEEQRSIFDKINAHLNYSYPAVYWISLRRESSKSPMTWVYPIEGEDRLCNLTEPSYWIHVDGEPDNHSNLNCVTMLFNNANYPDR